MSQELSANFVNNMNILREKQSTQFYINIVSLHKANWSLQDIADAFGVSKSAVANWEKKGKTITDNQLVAVVGIPVKNIEKPETPSKESKQAQVDFPIEAQQTILKLAQMASKVSRNTPADAPSRKAAMELEEILHYYKDKGVSYSKLAAAAGVTRRAIAQRLEKNKNGTKTSHVYQTGLVSSTSI